MANYLNAARALCDWLIETLDAGPAGIHRRFLPSVPADLFSPTAMPCHVVQRVGGADLVVGLDVVRLNVDTYATGTDPMQGYDAVLDRAEDVRRALRVWLPGQTLGGLGGAAVSRVRVESAPTLRPYDSRHQIRLAQAVYELALHRAI